MNDSSGEHRIEYVERVFGFRFQGHFRDGLAAMDDPGTEVDQWYRNAQVFARVTLGHPASDEDKALLLVMVESARLAALVAARRAQRPRFDFATCGFPPAFVAAWSGAVIREVRAQAAPVVRR